MAAPAVSIIIPTYNRPGPLCELLECIAQQSYRDLEVIVVNDAGEDIEWVRSLYPDLALTLLRSEQNRKHVHARNLGLQYARGEWIMLCDDDDLILSSHIERMVGAMEGYDFLFSDVEIFGYEIQGRTRIPTTRHLFAYEWDLAAMRRFSTFVSSGCLYRRMIHEHIGYFDPEVYHYWDWDFFLRVASACRVRRIPVASALYAFSPAGGNISDALSEMEPFLGRLAHKHDLGDLPVKNFFLLLEEPEVKARRSSSTILWDGQPIVSRWALRAEVRGDA